MSENESDPCWPLDCRVEKYFSERGIADRDPCPHDCATGIGTVSTMVPEWSGTIWECTVCHAIGEDELDGSAIVWNEAGRRAQVARCTPHCKHSIPGGTECYAPAP